MTDGEDFLWRPILEGMCRFESLKEGTVTLNDIASMNEALNVRAHNMWLLSKKR